jgi:hypothetical protein
VELLLSGIGARYTGATSGFAELYDGQDGPVVPSSGLRLVATSFYMTSFHIMKAPEIRPAPAFIGYAIGNGARRFSSASGECFAEGLKKL